MVKVKQERREVCCNIDGQRSTSEKGTLSKDMKERWGWLSRRRVLQAWGQAQRSGAECTCFSELTKSSVCVCRMIMEKSWRGG